MTNNNWETPAKIRLNTILFGNEQNINNLELLDMVIQEILTKKDQEHKAELDIIRGKVQDMREEGEGDLRSVISILDSHINKL